MTTDEATCSTTRDRPRSWVRGKQQMRMRSIMALSAGLVMLAMTTDPVIVAAQTVTGDPSARLSAVLPANVARQLAAVISDARSENLPADALANRSLKFAARGIAPQDIVRAAGEQLSRMRSARDVLRSARTGAPSSDEIEAGAEALREGVKGADVAKLAQGAPSGRSLAVPLYVIGSLVSRGLRSDEALQRVQGRLTARASDGDIESVGRGDEGAGSHRNDDGDAGRGRNSGRPGGEGEAEGSASHGPPDGIPGNAGEKGRPNTDGGEHGKSTGKGHP